MKIHLIRKETIKNYTKLNPFSIAAVEDWLTKLDHADWQQPGDIKRTYNSADLLGKGSHRVIFDLGGNNYRMISKYAFGQKCIHLFICWIGTHTEYDKICKENKQYTINIY